MKTVETANQILNHLKALEDEMIDYLETLVAQESPSLDPNAQEPIFETLAVELHQLGFDIKRNTGKQTGGYLFARPIKRIKDNDLQLIIGHCDTVWPLGTLQSMPIVRKEKQLTGPGVYDMKAGLTQIIFALKTIKSLGLVPSITPLILINADEEIGSKESGQAIRRLAKISRRAYVLEPPLGFDGKLKTSRKGIGRFTLTVKGEAAHAGLDPEKGASAIVELSHQIQKLFQMNDHGRGITVNVGMIEGGVSANMVAPESKCVIDVRVKDKRDGKIISKEIKSLKPSLPGTELSIEGGIGRPPMVRNSRNQALWHKAQISAQRLGIDLEQSAAGGGSDGNTTSQYTATLDGLGTVGDGAHAQHEFIFTDKLLERTALLALLILND